MKLKTSILLSFLIIPLFVTIAQDDIQIGSDLKNMRQTQGAYYDYSDPEGINIKVQLWGFVKYPGYYIVPSTSRLIDLLSLAGGPGDDAHLEDIRLYRAKDESSNQFLKYNYDELLWQENLTAEVNNPRLNAGDMIIVPGSPRFYFKDYLSIGLSIFSALISLVILVININ